MADVRQSKCPHCGSLLRLTEAQLAKGGLVRCASCLQSFRPDQHLVGAAVAAPAPAKPKPKKAADDEAWAKALLSEEGVDPSELEERPSHDEAGIMTLKHVRLNDEPTEPDLHTSPVRPEPPSAPSGARADNNNTKLSLGQVELSDFMSEASLPGSASTTAGRKTRFDEPVRDLLAPEPEPEVLSANADETWARSILSELEQEEKTQSQKPMAVMTEDSKAKKAPAPGKPTPSSATLPPAATLDTLDNLDIESLVADSQLDEHDSDALDFLNEMDAPASLGTAPTPAELPSFLSTAGTALPDVHEPVRLRAAPPRHWGRLVAWSLACLIAATTLLGQYIGFNLADLAASEGWRPLLVRACDTLKCQLPSPGNVSKLSVREVVSRTHPRLEGALVVDAILENRASYAQPLPLLLLTFTDRNDQVVASRLFKPKDYLKGEAASLSQLPPAIPVHIAIEIWDPGQSAVNTRMDPLLL